LSRHDASRLSDIVEAIETIRSHLGKGDLIGEAVKGITPQLLEHEPDIPWSAIARMRDHLTHHYFDTDHAVVQDVVDNELDPLLHAVRTLADRVEHPGGES
jgi:uncharacterized protein with HEPN domain